MRKYIFVSLLLGFSLLHAQSQANNPALRPFNDELRTILTASPNNRPGAIDDFLCIECSHYNQFVQYANGADPHRADGLAKQVQQKLANQVEQSRLDLQSGSSPGSSGSSSAVVKAGLSSILSTAIESGAITQAINGNTINVTGNVDAVARFLSGAPPIPFCPTSQVNKGCGTPVLKDLGFSVSVDTDQNSTKTASTSTTDNPAGTPSSVNLLAGKNRFSGATLKYVFRNPRDVHSKEFQSQWTGFYETNEQKFKDAGAQLSSILAKVFSPIIRDQNAAYTAIQMKHKPLLLAATNQAALETEMASYLDDVLAFGKANIPDFENQLRSVLSAYMLYLGNVNQMLQTINEKTVFSAEYDFQRPQGQPDTSAFRIMSSFNPFGPDGTFSVNLAGTFYNSSSVSSQFGRWRDAQASLQLERRIGGDMANYPARFSLAAYFQYMVSPGLISLDSSNFAPGTNINLGQSAAIALAPAGPIWIGEAKVTLKLKSSGAEIPISITQSNRTDLIKSTTTRGHIGLTFDFGKLFGSN
ncbi:MAG TPA: hypothetical protein VFR24_25980 [Candidatus Angelobacter sp.]|nr:hypothetical protein [Candidatus Angelobacter sp.]